MRNVVLIGFMGTGKSAVGQMLARRLGWTFVDTDRRIEAREDATVAQIFARHGEEYFRQVESRIVADVASRRDTIIATGGGVVLRPQNMQRLRTHGWIVSLTAPVDVLLKRLGNGEGRPLLRSAPRGARAKGDARSTAARLLDQRRPLYRDADLMVDVSVAPPERVAAAIIDFLGRRERRTVPVRLDARTYPVHVGAGIVALLPADLGALGAGRTLALLSHRSVLRAVGSRVQGVLKTAGFSVTAFEVPAGEQSKSLGTVGQLWTRLARIRFDRQGTLVAVGGGVIGDLAGFVASTYMRGTPFVQIPTTLLAMVDSSIGGKTGINHARVKNLIGTFYQPSLVVADVQLLATLPPRELRSGLAEVIKTAVIGDPELFAFLEHHLPAVLRRDPQALSEVVARCAAVKARVVETDETDRAERAVLNYGHTIGHAVEAATGFHRLTHGEAVAVGMALEAHLAQRLGVTDAGTVERQNALLARAGLPVKLNAVNRSAVWRALVLDKKTRNGVLRWPLLVGIGTVRREQEVPDGLLREVLGGQSARRVRAQSQPVG